MNILKKILQLSLLTALLTGCSLPVVIRPPPAATKIAELCIINNPKVLMDGFLPELESQIKGYGIFILTTTAYNPAGCHYWLEYTANWRWDFAMVLMYAQLKLYDQQLLIGDAVFDITQVGFPPYYYGPAAEKLKALTGPLFAQTLEQK